MYQNNSLVFSKVLEKFEVPHLKDEQNEAPHPQEILQT